MGNEELRRDLSARVLLHRRTFLGLVAAGAGSLVLGACSDDGSDGSNGSVGSSDPSPATSTTVAGVPGAQGLTADPFTLGVASGDPLPGSVVLWTRLAPDRFDPSGAGGMADAPVEVLWEVAADEGFTDLVASGVEQAVAEFGHTVHAEPEGLDPDTWYWYRFRVGDFTSQPARTRTTPADGAEVAELRFAFASCQLRSAGAWTAYDHLVADEPDLVFFLGDYVYEYGVTTGEHRIPLEAEPADLADYRVLYAGYKQDPKIQAAHAVAPWVVTWDDHEVENNHAADLAEDPVDQARFDERRRAAYQAFWEHHPVRLDPPASDGSLQVARTVRYGSLATFLVLDGRQFRDDQPCGDRVGVPADSCAELDDEDRSMLGADQEAWLADELAASTATWTVLAQQTVVKALVLGDLVLNVDQWDGYPAARRRLFASIVAADLPNVVVLTGDIHAGGAADLRTPDARTTGDIIAAELVAPGISSPGFGAIVEDLDLSSLGLAYVNFADNGYVRCTVTPETWTAEFLVVDTIAEATSDISVDATLELTNGTPGLRRL